MDRGAAWCIFFAQVAAWSYHPGAGKGGNSPLTLNEAASVADDMLLEFIVRFERKE